jgi:hypothetical protein
MEIELKLERLEEGRAFLRDEKGRLLVWPRDLLPSEALEGDLLPFSYGRGGNIAKDILNEIFT